MSNQDGLTRRAFIPGAAALIVPRHVLGGPGYQAPSDTLNIAGVGVAGMGRGARDGQGRGEVRWRLRSHDAARPSASA